MARFQYRLVEQWEIVLPGDCMIFYPFNTFKDIILSDWPVEDERACLHRISLCPITWEQCSDDETPVIKMNNHY